MAELGPSVEWDEHNLQQIYPVILDALSKRAPPASFHRADLSSTVAHAALKSLGVGIRHVHFNHGYEFTDATRFSFLIDGWPHIWKWLHFFCGCALESSDHCNHTIGCCFSEARETWAVMLQLSYSIECLHEVAERCDGYARTLVRVWTSAIWAVMNESETGITKSALAQIANSQDPVVRVLQRVVFEDETAIRPHAVAVLTELRKTPDLFSFCFEFLSLMVRISSIEELNGKDGNLPQILLGASILAIFLNDWQDCYPGPGAVPVTMIAHPVLGCPPTLLPLIVRITANLLTIIEPRHTNVKMAGILQEVIRLIPDFLVTAVEGRAPYLLPLYSQCLEGGLLIVARRMQLFGQCTCQDHLCLWSPTAWGLILGVLDSMTQSMNTVLFGIASDLRLGSYQVARSIRRASLSASQDSWIPGSAGNFQLRKGQPYNRGVNSLSWDDFCLSSSQISTLRLRYRWCHPLCSGPQCRTNRSTTQRPMRCAGCLQAYYCSRACQKADWKAKHSGECDTLRSEYRRMGGEIRLTNADLAFGQWLSHSGRSRKVDLPKTDGRRMIQLPKDLRTKAPYWDNRDHLRV